jgi:pseudouridine 5'-phosphatase
MDSCHGRKTRIEAVLFDLDGTLLDTESLSTQAMDEVLGKYGKVSTWELKEKIIGLRGPEWSQIVVEELDLVGELDPHVLLCEQETNLAMLSSSVVAMDGAVALIEELHKRKIPMGISTSSTAASVAAKRGNHENIFGKMDVIVTGDHPAVINGKPAPDIYIETARLLNVETTKCLVFEDSFSGLQSGIAAGCICAAIPDLRHSNLSIFRSTAHIVLDSLDDVVKKLDDQNICFV